MPKNITIENLYVDDSRASEKYSGIRLLGNIVEEWTDTDFEKRMGSEGYPYSVPETLTISGFSSASGRKWTLTKNTFMYRTVKLTDLDK